MGEIAGPLRSQVQFGRSLLRPGEELLNRCLGRERTQEEGIDARGVRFWSLSGDQLLEGVDVVLAGDGGRQVVVTVDPRYANSRIMETRSFPSGADRPGEWRPTGLITAGREGRRLVLPEQDQSANTSSSEDRVSSMIRVRAKDQVGWSCYQIDTIFGKGDDVSLLVTPNDDPDTGFSPQPKRLD